jgi:hypothetical protein
MLARSGSTGDSMVFDASWMAYGLLGGVQAGLISLLAGAFFFGVFHLAGTRHAAGYGAQIGWSFLWATALSAGGDLWNLFYLNYGQLQSLALLQAKLAGIHDPDNLGLRVLCELLGVVLGIALGWFVSRLPWARWLRRR